MAHERVASPVVVQRVSGSRPERASLVKRLSRKPGGDNNFGYLLKGAAVVLAALIALLLHWGVGAAFMLALLAVTLFSPLVGRLCVWAALAGIALCPLLVIIDQNAWLQQSPLVNYYAANMGLYTLNSATDTIMPWVFYLLGMGLIGRIASYARFEKRFDEIRYGTK